jgi:hypothetical protein
MLILSDKFWVFSIIFLNNKLGGYFGSVIVCLVIFIVVAWNGDGGWF